MQDLTPFDEATALRQVAGDLSGSTHPAFQNMNGPLGGWTVAILLNAVLTHPERLGDPVALTVNFCAPINGDPFTITPSLQRAGKSTQHWFIVLRQGDVVAATATVLTAVRRDTWGHAASTMPCVSSLMDTPVFETGKRLPWLEQFEFRFCEGAIDLSPHADGELRNARSVVWLSQRPPRKLDFLGLAALSDVFFVRIIQVRGQRGPMGTVTLTTYFHCTQAELDELSSSSVLGVADAEIFHRNFHDQSCQLWSADGRLLASGVQMAWYRD